MEQLLPFPIRTRPWLDLPEKDRDFFRFGDEYLPLHPNLATQIALLDPADGARVSSWAFAAIPEGWPDRTEARFKTDELLNVSDCRNDPRRRSEVRHWLFSRGVPFRRTVYLLYERDRVVQTTWRMVVRYWEAFAWSVDYAMVAVDHTLQWACCFHHENVIVFGSHERSA